MMKPDAIQRFEPFRPSQPEQVRARERKVEQAPPVRAAGRTGRRLLGLGALLILSGAVGYGAWRHYQAHADVMATAQQARDFIPAVLTAPVRASSPTVSVFWPG
jgi:hypothetical protein